MILVASLFVGFFAPGARPYHRLNFELEMLERREHEQVRSDMRKLPKEISEALGKARS